MGNGRHDNEDVPFHPRRASDESDRDFTRDRRQFIVVKNGGNGRQDRLTRWAVGLVLTAVAGGFVYFAAADHSRSKDDISEVEEKAARIERLSIENAQNIAVLINRLDSIDSGIADIKRDVERIHRTR